VTEGGIGEKGLPSAKDDSKAELEGSVSNELCFPSKGALRLDAGVTERFDGLVGRVAGLLSSEGRLILGAEESVRTGMRSWLAKIQETSPTHLR
jgi:hypothetical protein